MTKSVESVAVIRAIRSVGRYAGSDAAAFTSGLTSVAAGGTLLIPSGARALSQNNGTLMSVPGNVTLAGDGDSTVVTDTEQSVAGVSTLFNPQGADVTLQDFALNIVKGVGGGVPTVILASPIYNDFSLRGMKIDGGVTLSAGTQDRIVQLFKASTTNSLEGVTFACNHVENFGRAYTRDNSNAVAHKRVKAFFNFFKKAWRTVYTFNAPGGSIEDVLVIGESFDTHEGVVQADTGIAGNHNAVGFVGVRGGRVIGNHVSGAYGAVAHVEENTDCTVVIANTARMRNASSADAALEVLANNVSGATVVPQHVLLTSNVLQSTDNVGKGAYLQSQAGGIATQWSAVSNNIFADFDEAYRVDTDARSVLVTGNVLKGVTNAAELNRASLLFTSNLLQVTAETLHVTRGGLVGAVHYANLSSETGTITSLGASANSPVSVTEWTWETGLFSVAAGVSTQNICPMPTRMYGRMSIALVVSGAIFRHFEHAVKWDGATLTPNSIVGLDLYYGSGSIDILPVNNGGQLAIQFTNGGGLTANARLQVRFHSGQHIV